MSSTRFDATIEGTLELAPRASLRALSLLLLLHGSVGLLMLVAQPPGPYMTLGVVVVALSWLRLRRHPVFGFGPAALTRLTWHASGGWTLHQTGGASFEAELQGNSLVLPGLLVLNFRLADGARRSRALLGDELDPDLLKRLRARLKLTQG